MNFLSFVDAIGFSDKYVAQCLLYHPKKRPSVLAKTLGYKPTELEKAQMRKLIAGRGDVASLFPEFKQAS